MRLSGFPFFHFHFLFISHMDGLGFCLFSHRGRVDGWLRFPFLTSEWRMDLVSIFCRIASFPFSFFLDSFDYFIIWLFFWREVHGLGGLLRFSFSYDPPCGYLYFSARIAYILMGRHLYWAIHQPNFGNRFCTWRVVLWSAKLSEHHESSDLTRHPNHSMCRRFIVAVSRLNHIFFVSNLFTLFIFVWYTIY